MLHRLLRSCLLLCLLSCTGTLVWADSGLARPNVVVILCDDLGYGDLQCYGHPRIKTPHLNRMAENGIRFTSCYSAAPVCSPSRVGLLTGRSPNRAGVFDWIPPARSARPDAREQVHMRSDEITMPALLQRAGYATCHAGKWHCNSRFNRVAQPQPGDAGFDHWLSTQNNAAPSHENPVNYVRNGEAVGPMQGFSCQLAVDEVVHWLERRDDATRQKPFFVYLAFHEPHEPVASPAELVKQYSGVSDTEDQAQYFANVANVDAAVGRLMKQLEQMGIIENTVVVFTSDNGPETLNRYRSANRSYGTPGDLRGMKLHTHEAGFRVPGILQWPGKVKPGQVVDTAVSSLDFLPTFCRLAGIELPDGLRLDGMDITPLLQGEQVDRSSPLVWCYFNALNEARVAMRLGQWKVLARILPTDGGDALERTSNLTPQLKQRFLNAKLANFEIYHLGDDLGESDDLAETCPIRVELQERMRREYRALLVDSHVWSP